MQQQNRIRGTLFSRKRGAKGKNNSDTTNKDFWKYYYGGNVKSPIPFSTAGKLLKDLMKEVSNQLLNEEYVALPQLGFFGLGLKDTNSSGAKKRINWPETEKLWQIKYPGLTREELKEIKDKPLIPYRNKIGIYKSISVIWIKTRPSYFKRIDFEPITRVRRTMGQFSNGDKDRPFMNMNDLKNYIHALRKGVRL